MASFVKPHSVVFSEFESVPSEITDPLRAHIAGPHAGLNRYSVSSEKSLINLGDYDPTQDTEYSWPNKTSGSIIDEDYVKLFIDDAHLLYFEDLVGAESTIAPVSGYSNRIRSDSVAFKQNTTTYPRDSTLLDRDVQVNDPAFVRGTSGGTSYELWTYVKGFKGEAVAATTGSSTAASSNKSAQGSLAVSIDKIAGADNCITLTADASSYDGLEDGDIDETYTIEVISGSVSGDLTTAELRVTSASGNDDDTSLTPSAAGEETDIGTRGLKVTFDNTNATSCSSAANVDEVSHEDFVPGQKWTVHVLQAFTLPTHTSGGTYTGTSDTTYIVEVTKGGTFDNVPQITVTTTTGIDVSGPTNVPTSGDAVSVGTKGVTITFTAPGLCKGDKYHIVVTAEKEGSMQTLILGHDLPDEIQSASDLDLKLYIKKNIQVEQNRTGAAPLTNWATSQTLFTVKSGIIAFDSTWTNNSVEQALDVKKGTLYVEYREWLSTYSDDIYSIDNSTDIETNFGTVHPDNPIAWALDLAVQNTRFGTTIYFTTVSDPDDTDKWDEVLDKVAARDDLYSLVPLTRNSTVQTAYLNHVKTYSTAETSLWRRCFLNLAATTSEEKIGINKSDDGEVVLATLSDDPDTSGTQYTLLTITSDNAELITDGVAAGDTVRYLFSTDGFGNDTYTEFTIDSVESENTVKLKTGHTVAISTAQKVEIWHTLTKDEIANDLVTRAAALKSKQLSVVWPDTTVADGLTTEGYHVCAALAALRSSVAPHQTLTNVQLKGFDSMNRTTKFFGLSQINTLKSGGVWVVTQDLDGIVSTLLGISTDTTDINSKEEQVVANVDSIRILMLRSLRTFKGSVIYEGNITAMRVQAEAVIEFLKSNNAAGSLGPQLIDGEITQLRQHTLLNDTVLLAATLEIPYALNDIDIHITV